MRLGKRSKANRKRGTTWHGWGRGKAHHKGAGSRGGRGMAGTGKRGDQKKPNVWSSRYFGKSGFKKGEKQIAIGINLGALDQRIETLAGAGKVTKEGDMYTVDLSKIGYDKLLGAGATTKKLNIVGSCSKKAAEKVVQAGGRVEGAAQEA